MRKARLMFWRCEPNRPEGGQVKAKVSKPERLAPFGNVGHLRSVGRPMLSADRGRGRG
jgi:hypothetical protein